MAGQGDGALVALCNSLLAQSGLVATVSTMDEVKIICSKTSLFVAACEAMLGKKLEGVIRRPANDAERASNCDHVVGKLADELHTDLHHISGERVVQGNLRDIGDLAEILAQFSKYLPRDTATSIAPSITLAPSSLLGEQPKKAATGGGGRKKKAGAGAGKKSRADKSKVAGRPMFLVSATPSLPADAGGSRRVQRVSDSYGTSTAWDPPITIPVTVLRPEVSLPPPRVTRTRVKRTKPRRKAAPQSPVDTSGEGGILGSSLEAEPGVSARGSDSKDESMSSISVTARGGSYSARGSRPAAELPAKAAQRTTGGAKRPRSAPGGGKGGIGVFGKSAGGAPRAGGGGAAAAAAAPRRRQAGLPRKTMASAAAKLGGAPRLDRVLAARLQHVLSMRDGDGFEAHRAMMAQRRTQEFEMRASQRRGLFIQRRRHEAAHAERCEETKRRLAERGERHRDKVARIRAERFWAEMELQDRSRRTRRLAHEAELFKGLFLEAVDAEKEKILGDRAEERRRRREELDRELDRQQRAEAVSLDHFTMLEDALHEERQQMRVLERSQEQLMREVERDARDRLERERRTLRDAIAHEEDAAFYRQVDPTLVGKDVFDAVKGSPRKSAPGLQPTVS